VLYDLKEAYAHGGLEVSTHFLCQQVEPVLDEFLDLGFPRRSIRSFPVAILRDYVSLIEGVT